MATGGYDTPETPSVAARFWRVVGIDTVTPDMWDVALLDVVVRDAEIVGVVDSGNAGPDYAAEQAFDAGGGWWGGRPSPMPDGTERCHLGIEFDRAAIPEAITLAHAAGRHRARRVRVESSIDGAIWVTRAEIDLPVSSVNESSGPITVFAAPTDAPSARGWRIVATTTTHGFAWDLDRISFVRSGIEVDGTITASGDAGAAFGIAQALDDGDGCWGGRPDDEGRLHVTLRTDKSTDIEIDRIVLHQRVDHHASAVVVERRGDDGSWVPWRHVSGLGPGRHEVPLAGPIPPRAAVRDTRRHVDAGPVSSDDPFADRRILVLVAAYRDPELPATISNALAQAAYPEHVRFAICHQFDDDTAEQLAPWDDDPRFRVDAVVHTESGGCCWARHRTFALHDDEPYVLQIDAHMRFAARWDVRFIEMLESVGTERAVLSSYPPRYTIAADGTDEYDLTSGAQRLFVDEVHDDLTTRQRTTPLADVTRPEPSPVLAAGQIFTRGTFCRDVDYDPEIYFSGEEISLSARAFTHGYDFFAPHEVLVWHLYQHEHPKHWQDHETHADRHRAATGRLRTLFRGDHRSLGRHGLGSMRSLAEFEDRAGIRLGARRPTHDHLSADRRTLRIDRSTIEPRDDYEVFVLAMLDADGEELGIHEVRSPEVLELVRDTIVVSSVPSSTTRFLLRAVTRRGVIGEAAVRAVDAHALSGAAS